MTRATKLNLKVCVKFTTLIKFCRYFTHCHVSAGFSYPNYIVTSQPTSVGSDSEASVTSQCSFVVQPADPIANSTYIIAENDADFYDEDELWKLEDGEDESYVCRPAQVGLVGKSGSTPVSSRKPRFQFTGKKLKAEYILNIIIYLGVE